MCVTPPIRIIICLVILLFLQNALQRPARTKEGLEVIVRVVVVGSDGHDHLKILRKIAAGENSILSNNHTLPMVAELQFEDIIFCLFPKTASAVEETYGYWVKDPVGDVLFEMIMQILSEVSLVFFFSRPLVIY